jgi:iron(III) transport system substrate-binding protein
MPASRLFPAFVTGLVLAIVLAACAPAAVTTPAATPPPAATPATQPTHATTGSVSGDLVIYSGRSEALIAPVIEQFRAQHPEVNVLLKAGSNSELANAILEERANPQADLFITTEIFTVQKLANEGVLQAYRSPQAAGLDQRFQSPDGLWSGLTLRARVIMFNTQLIDEAAVPRSITELTGPAWRGQVAAAGSTNGSMQAQLGAMRQLLGDEATEAWLRGVLANEITFFGGHTDVRKAVGAGEFQLGLVNHYYYHLQRAEGSPVGVVYPDQGDGQPGLIVNATSAAITRGARHPEAARAFIDYLLSAEGQQTFAQLNYEYPLRPGVALHPDVAPLSDFRLAQFDIVQAANELESTLDLIEHAGVP